MKCFKLFLVLIFALMSVFVVRSQEGESLKFEIFHVDLVPATFLYGGLELAWSLAMYDALDKTIAAQQEIDTLFRKLVILEEKTQEYQKNLQSAFLETLNPQYVDRIVTEIKDIQSWIDEYASIYPSYNEVARDFKTKITDRSERIKRYIDDAAKKTGNEGRLDNRQRSDLNLYTVQELQKLKLIAINLQSVMITLNPPMRELRLPVNR